MVVSLGVCLAGFVVSASISPTLFGSRADAQQVKSQHAGGKIKTVVEVRPWHLLKIIGPQKIELETTAETCTGLLPPKISKVRKVEGRRALRVTVWVKREIAGECLSEATFVQDRVVLGAPLRHRAIYDGSTNPPTRRWPE